MAVSISRLSIEHHRSALGIAETRPRISWRFAGDAKDWEQTSYDIEITPSGEKKPTKYSDESADSILVDWPGEALGSAEQVSVRARAHGGKGQPSTPWSDWVSVETGLLEEKDWGDAVPIAADRATEKGEPKRAIYFRREFELDGEVESARLYITAWGMYEAAINGDRVGDAVLAPGWQSYNYRHVYNTYDVTKNLGHGDNAIGILVGEGWFIGRMGFEDSREHYGDTVGTIALLRATLKNGTVVEIATDPNWKASTGPIVTSEIYDGEVYDSRLEEDIKGWASPGFNADDWLDTKELPPLNGKLSSPDDPPIRRLDEIKPQRIFKSPSGKQLLDFGQNLVGWLRIRVEGPSGTNITLHHAEVLEDGELALRPLRTALARDSVILHGNGPQTWEPHFTFHGFRYAQIDGWPEYVPLNEDSVTAIVMWTDMEPTGDFTCSHELLSKFFENVRWSMRGNFLSLPTDCPQRDERLGWTGDAHAFGPTSSFLYDTAGFWRGWHRDMWSEMQRNDSMIVPFFVPTLPTNSHDNARAYWGDVAVGNPWNQYNAFGDPKVLEEQFAQARAWIDTGIPRKGDGLWDRSGDQFGDWLDPKAPPEDAGAATTHAYLVADAYLVEMTLVLSKMASTLGDAELEERYTQEHDRLRQAFQESWMDDDGNMANRTQTAYALSLAFDLYTNETQQGSAAQTLRDIISENDYLVGTGFAGTPALGPALERIGAVEDFYAMLLQTRVPSWLYQVDMGATTTWERWDSMLPNGSVNPGSMTSFNHYAFGSVADWIHGVVGGLRPQEPGWKVIEVAPVPGGNITEADTKFVSPYGEIKVQWQLDGDDFTMSLTVPPNSVAEVTVPGGEMEKVGSGGHKFSAKIKGGT